MKNTHVFISVFITLMLCTLSLYSGDTTHQKRIYISSEHKQKYTVSNDNSTWWNRSTTNGSALLSTLIMFFASLISSVIILIFGVRGYKQWKREQKWRRKEAIFKRIDALSATPGVHNAILMLSSSDRDIALWDKSDASQRYERVKREQVALALLPHSILPNVYSRKESAIRDSFR